MDIDKKIEISYYKEYAKSTFEKCKYYDRGNFEPLKTFEEWYVLFNILTLSSYFYYMDDTTLISDYTYDKLCRYVHDNYEIALSLCPIFSFTPKEHLKTGFIRYDLADSHLIQPIKDLMEEND